MTDDRRGIELAEEGYRLWQGGAVQEAAERYAQAVGLLDPDHYRTPLVHGEYASVLIALGRYDEARQQYEAAVAIELRQDPSGKSSGVTVARYLLGELLLQSGDAQGALDVVAPSIACGGDLRHLLRIIQVEALHILGRRVEAREAAQAALAGSTSDEHRSRIRERLQHVDGGVGPTEHVGRGE